MKIIKSFFSILLLTFLAEGTEKNKLSPKTVHQGLSSNNPFDNFIDDEKSDESKELTTFFEGEFNPDKPVNSYNLKEPYTAYIINKIFRFTQNTGKLPTYAPKIFDALIHPNLGNCTQIVAPKDPVVAPKDQDHENNKIVYNAISESAERRDQVKK